MERVFIIGILNTTPDSYYDGGKFVSVERGLERAGEMLREGADIIEVGGESTGPGSKDISLEEELQRTIPLIRAIKGHYPEANVAIDTYKAEVAREAIQAGVMMVNDVTAGRGDLEMFRVLASARPCDGFETARRVTLRCEAKSRASNGRPAGLLTMTHGLAPSLVLMYAKDSTPRTTVQPTQYDDVVRTIKVFLRQRKEAALAAGISEEKIILDPGMGHFISSDPKYSFEVLARLREFQELGSPILLSPSRKSFLAGFEDLKPVDRLPGTIAASAIAVLHGALYIRTHDVAAVRRGCEVGWVVRTPHQVSG